MCLCYRWKHNFTISLFRWCIQTFPTAYPLVLYLLLVQGCIFCCIPSHVRMPVNKHADTLACSAVSSGHIVFQCILVTNYYPLIINGSVAPLHHMRWWKIVLAHLQPDHLVTIKITHVLLTLSELPGSGHSQLLSCHQPEIPSILRLFLILYFSWTCSPSTAFCYLLILLVFSYSRFNLDN